MYLSSIIQHDAGVLMSNHAGDTPLDLAIRYNRKGMSKTKTICLMGSLVVGWLSQWMDGITDSPMDLMDV